MIYNRDVVRNLEVEEILERFDLRKPIFKEASIKGHFGDPGLPWEK